MLKALLLKPDDSVAVIHRQINQPLVRLGAVEGGAQYRAIELRPFNLCRTQETRIRFQLTAPVNVSDLSLSAFS